MVSMLLPYLNFLDDIIPCTSLNAIKQNLERKYSH